jgi:hypothetical protein
MRALRLCALPPVGLRLRLNPTYGFRIVVNR